MTTTTGQRLVLGGRRGLRVGLGGTAARPDDLGDAGADAVAARRFGLIGQRFQFQKLGLGHRLGLGPGLGR